MEKTLEIFILMLFKHVCHKGTKTLRANFAPWRLCGPSSFYTTLLILFLTAISFTASAQNEVTCDTRVTFSNPVTQSEVNTLYIGANHKISIKAAGVAPANLVIKLSKGVIEGNNGSYIARVFSVGEALIQVYSNENGAEKKLAEKTLQTRVIPRPGSEEFKEVVKSLGPKVIGQ